MDLTPQLLLVGAVAAVGVLHTIVPDHWLPITLIARQRGWSSAETARAALGAGTGHVGSTLAIGIVVWLAGVAFATRFGTIVSSISSLALVGFGGWVAVTSLHEMREHGGPARSPSREDSTPSHGAAEAAPVEPGASRSPLRHSHGHGHGHSTVVADPAPPARFDASAARRAPVSSRTALLLILGSSPMIEGLPAFFAAGKYGLPLIAAMAAVFAVSTISTYVVMCVVSAAGFRRVKLGAFERYGEVLSGSIIMLVGFAFAFWPVL